MFTPDVDSTSIDKTLGVIYLAVAISSVIYGTTCAQAFLYYRSWRAKDDCLALRYGITVSMLVDTAHQVFVLHLGYYFLISHFGDRTAPLTSLPWSAPAQVLCLSVSALFLNSFLTARIWKLTRSMPITALLGLLTIVTAATNIAFALRGYQYDSLIEGLVILKPHGIAGIAISIGTELSLGLSLSYQLYRHRTGTAMTDDLITKVILVTVPTGMLMTPLNIADLIAYITVKDNLYVLLFNFILAKLYTSAFLTTLNLRDYLRHIAMETHNLESFMQSYPLTAFFSRNPRPTGHVNPASSCPPDNRHCGIGHCEQSCEDLRLAEDEVIHLRPLSQDLGLASHESESLHPPPTSATHLCP
ncbi:hypothetical protein L226DRAFT_559699 [Lentinus tigrinus ALCF2SS1-7]|uniref:DUF6534 domain-containing protein n=1 Tax=Lentinus tigrinus ALCF2SS1-6 TaxID=1328759 RepID=A0A5C2SB76_9APHY|nr:hypothetical protein L227DRAFT_600768 [Lentinus tigrinus ALCF2SS1-6]RPD75778.1 hypothetical protein L226DRAFT_559699 [Lentinus tigrinus ALCF2SS1-7]